MHVLSVLGAAALLLPAGPIDIDPKDLLTYDLSATIVSIDVPWDGGGIEVGATAEEPATSDPILSSSAATRSAFPTWEAAKVSESTKQMLQRIASQGGPIQSQGNGNVSSALLCPIPWSTGFKVYCPALEALTALNEEYKATFGSNMSFASAYRSGYQGRSFHGWGLALDLNGPSGLLRFGDSQYQWLAKNAPNYGWYHPFWAGSNGSNPEPWHWEFGSYYGGVSRQAASAAPPVAIRWINHKG